MTVLTHGVGDPKITDLFTHPELDEHLLSMDEYIDIAKRVIGSIASPAAAAHMLNDEDAIAFVAHKLMLGTCRWVSGGKAGVHRGYLGQCGVWAVWTWSEQQNDAVAKDWDNISLYHTTSFTSDDERPIYLYQLIEDDKQVSSPMVQNETAKAVRQAVKNANLNDKEAVVVDMIYYQDMTMEQVGEILGVSRQRVKQLVDAIHRKIIAADQKHGVLDEYNPRTV